MKSNNQSLAVRMVPQAPKKKAASKAPSGLQAFISNMQYHPDTATAAQIVEDHAGFEFEAGHGAEVEELSRVLPSLNDEHQVSEAHVKALKKKRDQTPQFVKAAPDEKDSQKQRPFQEWPLKDRIYLLVTILALFIALCMGTANVYSNLIASGVGIFITKPYLALAISMLLPVASLAVKNITHFIHNPIWRRWYGLGNYGLALVMLVAWCVLFAMNYNGVAGGFNPDELLEDKGNIGSMLVFVQLLLELLIGSALFLTIEEITGQYSPTFFAPSMEYYEADKAYQTALAAHKKLQAEWKSKHGRLVQLMAEKQKFVNEAVASFVALKSRRSAQFSD